MASALIFTNPFDQARETVSIDNGLTINEWLDKSNYSSLLYRYPTVIMLNGIEVVEHDYDTVLIESDILTLVVLPQDPGTLATLETIANVLIIVTSIVTIALVLTQEEPELDTEDSTSSVYNIGSRQNQAKLGNPKPVIYGTMRTWPDLGAIAHVEFYNNEQYLYQKFEVSQGECEIDPASMRFDNTPLSDYEESEYEILLPGEESTIYPDVFENVDEVQNFQFEDTNFMGPYIAPTQGSKTSEIVVDITAPNGLMYVSRSSGSRKVFSVDVTFQAREIDDSDNVIGSWFNLTVEAVNPLTNALGLNSIHTLSGSDRTPLRKTLAFTVPAGRYQIQGRRVTAIVDNTRTTEAVYWRAARVKLVDTNDITTTTRVAVKVKASNEIAGGVVNKFNLIAKRKLNIWNSSTGWSASTVQTNNPVWSFIDACRATYGGKRSDSEIDLANLELLAAQFDADNIECNGLFDTKSTLWDALIKIGATCSSIPIDNAGVLQLIYDGPTNTEVQLFSTRNIVKDSFKISSSAVVDETADSVIIEYLDQDNDYRKSEVLCHFDGSTTESPRRIEHWGITEHSAAHKAGMRLVAQNQYRRRRVSFETGLEGRIPNYYDVVSISHFLIGRQGAKQVSGDIIAFDGSRTVTVSENIGGMSNRYLIIRELNGEASTPYQVSWVNDYQLYINGTFDSSPLVFDDGFSSPQFVCGEGTEFLQKVKITKREIVDDTRIALEGFIDDPNYYIAADSVTPPPPTTLPVIIGGIPRILELSAGVDGSTDSPVLFVSWTAENADYYILRYSLDSGTTWLTIDDRYIGESYRMLGLDTGDTVIFAVAGVNLYQGAFESITVVIDQSTLYTPLPVGNLKLSEPFIGPEFKIEWDSDDVDRWVVELYDPSALYLTEIVEETSYRIHANKALDAGGTRSVRARVYALSRSGIRSVYAEVSAVNPAPAQLNNVSINALRDTVMVIYDVPSDADFLGASIWASETPGFSPNDNSLVIEKDISPVTSFPIEVGQTLYVRIGGVDNWGSSANDLNLSGETTVSYSQITETEITPQSITTPLLSAGAVTADKMTVGSLSTITGNMGTLNAGLIHLQRAGGYYTDLTTDNEFIFWFGSGTKNEANAVAFMRDDGTFAINNDQGQPVLAVGPGVAEIDWTNIDGPTWQSIVDDGGKPADNADVTRRGIAIKLNHFNFITTNDGEFYICGYDDAGNIADVDGWVYINGIKNTIPKGLVHTNRSGEGYIVFDKSLGNIFQHGGSNTNIAYVRKNGQIWQYDNNATWVNFTPTKDHFIIGALATSTELINAGEVYQEARPLIGAPSQDADVTIDNPQTISWLTDNADMVWLGNKIEENNIQNFMGLTAITEAYIGNLAVSKLKIGGSQVTIPHSTYLASQITMNTNATDWQEAVRHATFTDDDGFLFIFMSFEVWVDGAANRDLDVRVLIDATEIYRTQIYIPGTVKNLYAGSVNWTPPDGTDLSAHNIIIEVNQNEGATIKVSKRSLLTLGTRGR